MASTALRTVALASLLICAFSYPTFWIAEDEAVADCLAHPIKAEGKHPAPKADKATTFTVTEAGAPVKALCPGGSYKLVVKFAEARRALLTTTAGTLKRGDKATCPNRSLTLKTESPLPTFEDTITIPCDITATDAEMRVTSATGSSGAFHDSTATMPISALADCPKSTCAAAAATPAAKNATAAAKALPAAAAEANTTTAAAAAATEGNATAATAAAPPAAAKSSAGMAAPLTLAAVALSLVLAVFGF